MVLARLWQALRDRWTAPARRQAELFGDWTLELDGEVIARLSGGRVPDQFWIEYDAEVLTAKEDLRAAMRTESFWYGKPLMLRSELTGRTVEVMAENGPLFAIDQAEQLARHGTLSLRGL